MLKIKIFNYLYMYIFNMILIVYKLNMILIAY